LKDFVFLNELSFAFRNDPDFTFLKSLINLHYLNIGISAKESHTIDLSNQINLEELRIQWRKIK